MEKNVDLNALLVDMVKAIVDSPDEVRVTTEEKDGALVMTLSVAESDMGMVIGRRGNIAKALRTVTKAAGKLMDKKIIVDIK